MNLQDLTQIMVYCARIQPRYAPDISNPAVLHFFFEEFKDVDSACFKSAMDSCLRSMDRFPAIPDINRQLGKAQLSDEQIARDAASVIVAAAIRFKSTRKTDEVREYVGELAWWIIERTGGWIPTIDLIDKSGLQIAEARFREAAKVKIAKAHAGLGDTPPALPVSRNQGLKQISERDILALIPGHGNVK